MDKLNHFLHLVRIYLSGSNLRLCLSLQGLSEGVALCFGTAGDTDLRKDLADLTAFPNGDIGDSAAAYNQYFTHFVFSFFILIYDL